MSAAVLAFAKTRSLLEAEAWAKLPTEALSELASEVAGLPTEVEAEDQESKRFDLLMLRLQLAVLRSEPGFKKMSEQVRAIAGLLEEKASIPMVQAQLSIIQEIQDDEWWQDVTVVMLENARKPRRSLVKLVDKQRGSSFSHSSSRFSPVSKARFKKVNQILPCSPARALCEKVSVTTSPTRMSLRRSDEATTRVAAISLVPVL